VRQVLTGTQSGCAATAVPIAAARILDGVACVASRPSTTPSVEVIPSNDPKIAFLTVGLLIVFGSARRVRFPRRDRHVITVGRSVIAAQAPALAMYCGALRAVAAPSARSGHGISLRGVNRSSSAPGLVADGDLSLFQVGDRVPGNDVVAARGPRACAAASQAREHPAASDHEPYE